MLFQIVGLVILRNAQYVRRLGKKMLIKVSLLVRFGYFFFALTNVLPAKANTHDVANLSIRQGSSDFSNYSKTHTAVLYRFGNDNIRILSECNIRPVWSVYEVGKVSLHSSIVISPDEQTHLDKCGTRNESDYTPLFSQGTKIVYGRGYLYPPNSHEGSVAYFFKTSAINTYPLSLILKFGALSYTKDLENQYLKNGSQLLVVAGTIKNANHTNNLNKTKVPDFVYKIIIRFAEGKHIYQAWIFPNDEIPTRNIVNNYLVSIASLKTFIKWPLPREIDHYLTKNQQLERPDPWVLK
jgi:hypothetical protein